MLARSSETRLSPEASHWQRKVEPMKMNRITPFLWYDGQAEDAAKFYCSIFKKSKIHSASPMSGRFPVASFA